MLCMWFILCKFLEDLTKKYKVILLEYYSCESVAYKLYRQVVTCPLIRDKAHPLILPGFNFNPSMDM